jgi:ribokinase
MPILLFGDINLDTTLHVPTYPDSGKDAIVQQVSTRVGGSTVNTAIALAGLNLPVRLLGRAGQDAAGDQALAALQAAGVDTDLVQRDDAAPTGHIFIVVSADGERTMFSARGVNTLITPESISNDALIGISHVHFSTYSFLAVPQRYAARKLLQYAIDQGIPCSLDIADGHAFRLHQELDSILPHLDMLLLNPADAAAILAPAPPGDYPTIVTALLGLGLHLVALKLGALGCLAATPEAQFTLPPLPTKVVDTTGAGDAFAAGLIFAHKTNLSLLDSAWLASAMGALATTVSGAGSALPGLSALQAYLASLPSTANPGGWRERVLSHLGYNPVSP